MPRCCASARRCTYTPDASLAALLPARVAVVEVVLTDGTQAVRPRGSGARHGAQSDVA